MLIEHGRSFGGQNMDLGGYYYTAMKQVFSLLAVIVFTLRKTGLGDLVFI